MPNHRLTSATGAPVLTDEDALTSDFIAGHGGNKVVGLDSRPVPAC